ncbi:MAG TPA: succinate--CoA ligase subunit alpha [Clostridiales bacterium]|nr:succinate--CoA ligase subunit alpha [Clostridiales bacterium]
MSILADENTRILVQGITGKQGRFHTAKLLESGASVVAGVSPGKSGEGVEGIPVYGSSAEALARKPEINASLILVPPKFVLSSGMEAVEARIPLVVIITEFTPVKDVLHIVTAAKKAGVQVVGPNTIGVISPGKSKVGVMPSFIYKPGRIGIISRSGTLTHEISSNLSYRGYGQSTCVGIGGDPIIGMNHAEALERFSGDDDTDMVILIGEIGGSSEEMAAEYIRRTRFSKPVAAIIAGSSAPPGKTMGHAGAIVSGNSGTAKSKIDALKSAGVFVGETMDQVIDFVKACDKKLGGRLMTAEPVSD